MDFELLDNSNNNYTDFSILKMEQSGYISSLSKNKLVHI